MQQRFFRWLVFVVLLLGCGSSKDQHVDTPPPSASSASVAPPQPSAAESATPVASASQAPPTPLNPPQVWKPLLYKIAGTKASYLFGTIHIPDARIATFPASLDQAIAASDEIVNEMPLDKASNPMAMMSSFQMPNGKTLATELPKPLYDRLKAAFVSKNLGMALPMMEHMKVWAVAAQVALIDHLMDIVSGGKAIDINIHDKAKAAGKPTSGVETEAEQLQVFDGLTKDEQARMLEQTLDQRDQDLREGNDPVAKLMNLYVVGDEIPLLTELNAGFDKTKPLDQKLLKRLITDRNKIMTDRIAAKVKASPNKAYFFAIGAAHLLGDDGVVAQLKKKGLTIERVQ